MQEDQKQPLNAKVKSIPPTLSVSLSLSAHRRVCVRVRRVQGAAAGHGIIERLKKNTACLNQAAGSEGMMGKQSRSPRSG